MTTQQNENERVLKLLAEHYQKGKSETIEEFEKILKEKPSWYEAELRARLQALKTKDNIYDGRASLDVFPYGTNMEDVKSINCQETKSKISEKNSTLDIDSSPDNFNLSENIIEQSDGIYMTRLLNLGDVKEFIRRLKHRMEEECIANEVCLFEDMDKLAGDKLT